MKMLQSPLPFYFKSLLLSNFFVFGSCQTDELQEITQLENSPDVVVAWIKITTARENNLISEILYSFLLQPVQAYNNIPEEEQTIIESLQPRIGILTKDCFNE